ncbi:chemotaxis protein CheW [Oligoflexus tunisiensis]|uniref:chemotaxis protein CheW n=1 Tax=Oligoflexus tunisiensis TaxID=708132 RepID=UPI00114CD516|nr:chemotaxis protein CheW [Oligoflexus tunisiensis]
MSDRDESEKLFDQMRKHFVEDPEGNLETLRECAASIGENPSPALKKALLVIHNMKGSAQAVGFSTFAALLHEMEEVLGNLQGGPETDQGFSELLNGIEIYFNILADTLEDLPGHDTACRQHLDQLKATAFPPRVQAPQGWGLFEETDAETANAEPAPQHEPADERFQAEIGKYLLLEQNHRLFAIHLNEVKEIVSDHYLNPLPHPQKGLKGIIVVRNRALPVMDLGSGMDEQANDAHICAVICESEEQSFAFRVQKPRQVISLQAQDFENVSDKSVLQGGQHHLFKTVARYNGQSVLIVDLKSMLAA